MNQDLHERALSAAYKKLPYSPGLHHVEPAIAEYLRVAGLTVVPVEPTREMVDAGEDSGSRSYTGTMMFNPIRSYIVMLAAFDSPFPSNLQKPNPI